jgi:putative RNA 2'-phosphotransferase
MKHGRHVDKLAKFLVYTLGRRPDEFGLIPDGDGYVKTKDLLKALAEESGWRHVRLNHLREVILTAPKPPVEMDGNRIRAVDRSRLIQPAVPSSYPKLLYYPVRQRAHPVVMEKGLPPAAGHRIVLADVLEMARRLGRRIDSSAVILTLNSAKALENGAVISRFGQHLFLSDRLIPATFSAPPLPNQRPVTQKAEKPPAPVTPGSYLLDLTNEPSSKSRMKKVPRQRKNEWKRERKRKNRDGGFG